MSAAPIRERGILFSAPMMLANLAGTKTMTRRVVKPQPSAAVDGVIVDQALDMNGTKRGLRAWFLEGDVPDGDGNGVPSPYGQPGDLLWFREAWRTYKSLDLVAPRDLHIGERVRYEADGMERLGRFDEAGLDPAATTAPQWGRLRPGMFMPRWASRFIAEVTEVRVECLQDISRGDAMAEGCPFPNMAQGPDPRQWYAGLWEGINGAGAWAANPWVWVVEFRKTPNVRVEPPAEGRSAPTRCSASG